MDPMAQAFREKKKWEESMGVGTLDKLFEAVQGKLPDYDSVDYLGLPTPEEHHIDYGNLAVKVGAGTVEAEQQLTKTASSSLTPAHFAACEKYPSLVAMLGNDKTGELAEIVAIALNEWIVTKIAKNSSSINTNAVECKEEEGSIKQYFKYNNRVGFVKVTGKFSGTEYVHYDPQKNEGYVLSKRADGKFTNLNKEFQVETQFVEA